MYIVKLPNAAAHKLAVTGTSTKLFDLIDTAGSTAANLKNDLNAIMLVVEDGDIRVTFDETTPTSVNGLLISQGQSSYFSGVPLHKMRLIRTGGSNVAVSIEVGYSKESDGFAISGKSVTTTTPVVPTSTIRSSAYEASHVISAAAATLKELRGFNSGAAQWIQIHDASSLPADTAVPEEIIYVGSNQNFSFTPPAGLSFTTGIVVCNSSTGPTKTIGAADCWFSADID